MKNILIPSLAVLFAIPSLVLPVPDQGRASFAENLKRARENPSDTLAQAGLARAYEERGDYTNAVRLRIRCVELEPDLSRHRVQLIRDYLKLGRPDLARPVAASAVRDFSENADVVSAHATVEYQMGDFRKALAGYARSLELSRSTNAWLLTGLAKSSRELKMYSRADAYFLLAVAMDRGPWAFYEYGKLLEDVTNRRRAVWSYEKARSLSYRENEGAKKLIRNRLSSALYALGMEYKEKEDHPSAMKTFRKITDDRELKNTPSAERAAFWLKRLK